MAISSHYSNHYANVAPTTEHPMTLTIAVLAPVLLQIPPVVVDSVRAAWDDSDQDAYSPLDTDWVKAYRDYLDPFAHELIRPFLAAAWRVQGLVLRVEEDGGFHPDRGNEVDPDAALRWAVWQSAADRITTEALLERAGIDPNHYLHA